MTTREALRVAIRELDRQYKATMRNVMADPRAEELRAEKMRELGDALVELEAIYD